VPLNKAVKQGNDNLLTPYINIASNVTQLGTSVTPPNRGATAAYPSTAVIGDQFFDITTNELKVYTVNGWVSAGTAPAAPTNVVATSAAVVYGGTPGAVITWTPATTGVPASSYVVTSNTGGFTTTTTGNTATIYGLTAGTSYTFTVAAKNSFGSSSATSNSLSPVTTPQTPTIGAPVIVAAGLSVPVTAGANGGSTITGYTVTTNPGNISITSATSPVLVPTIVPVTGGSITAGTIYSFTAVANNAAGSSLPTAASSKELDTPVPVTSGLLCNYDFYNGSYGGQNYVAWSQDVSQTSVWNTGTYLTSSGGTITSGIADPFGGTGAQLIVGGSVNPTLYLQNQPISATGGGTQTVSVYAKYYNAPYFTLNCFYDAIGERNVQFFVDGSNVITGDDTGTATITYVGNGWYKCQMNIPGPAASGSFVYRIWPSGRGLTGTGCYFFGHQTRNANTTAPGYIKTTSSTLNYNTGSTIYDLSGNGYNTTLNNFGGYSNSLANGYGSIIFNGAATTGAATGGSMPNMGTGFTGHTISYWANRASESKMLVAGSDGYIWGDNSWSGPNGEYYFSHNASIPVGTWGHWTFVANSNYTYNIYRNGYLESYSTGGYTGSISGTGNLSGMTLGNGYGNGYNWQGSLGKLSFYNRSLTASEALQNFNADRGRYGV
jgi:hypothetical protein